MKRRPEQVIHKAVVDHLKIRAGLEYFISIRQMADIVGRMKRRFLQGLR
jgi:hypothetical protein